MINETKIAFMFMAIQSKVSKKCLDFCEESLKTSKL